MYSCSQALQHGILASKLFTTTKLIVLEALSESMAGVSPEEISNIRVDDGPSRDEALVQTRSRAANEMMLAIRRRRYELEKFVHL